VYIPQADTTQLVLRPLCAVQCPQLINLTVHVSSFKRWKKNVSGSLRRDIRCVCSCFLFPLSLKSLLSSVPFCNTMDNVEGTSLTTREVWVAQLSYYLLCATVELQWNAVPTHRDIMVHGGRMEDVRRCQLDSIKGKQQGNRCAVGTSHSFKDPVNSAVGSQETLILYNTINTHTHTHTQIYIYIYM
jgi:hypothetical protein